MAVPRKDYEEIKEKMGKHSAKEFVKASSNVSEKKKSMAKSMSSARKGYNAQRKADALKPKRGAFKIK